MRTNSKLADPALRLPSAPRRPKAGRCRKEVALIFPILKETVRSGGARERRAEPAEGATPGPGKAVFLESLVSEIKRNADRADETVSEVLSAFLGEAPERGGAFLKKPRSKRPRASKRERERERARAELANAGDESAQEMFDEMFFQNSKLKDRIFAFEGQVEALESEVHRLRDENKFLNYKLLERAEENSRSLTAGNTENVFEDTFGEFEQPAQRKRNKHNNLSIGLLLSGGKGPEKWKRPSQMGLKEKMNLLKEELKQIDDSQILQTEPDESSLEKDARAKRGAPGLGLEKEECKAGGEAAEPEKESLEPKANGKQRDKEQAPHQEERRGENQDAASSDLMGGVEDSQDPSGDHNHGPGEAESDLMGEKEGDLGMSSEEIARLKQIIQRIINRLITLKRKGTKEVKVGKLMGEVQKIIRDGGEPEEEASRPELLYSESEVSINSDNEDEVYSRETLGDRLEAQLLHQDNEVLTRTARKMIAQYKRLIDRVRDLKKMKEMYRDMYFKKLGNIESQPTYEDMAAQPPDVSETKSFAFYNPEMTQLKELGEMLSTRISANLQKNLRQDSSRGSEGKLSLSQREVQNQNNLSFAKLSEAPQGDAGDAGEYQIKVLPARESMKGTRLRSNGGELEGQSRVEQLRLGKSSSVKFVNFLLSSIDKASKNSKSKGRA